MLGSRITKFDRQPHILILIIVTISPILGVLTALSPPVAIGLGIVIAVFLLIGAYLEQAMLFAIGFAPIGTGFVLHIGLFDIRIVQLVWAIILFWLITRSILNKWPIANPFSLGVIKPLSLFVSAAFIASINSPHAVLGFKETAQFVYLAIIFFILATNFSREDKLRRAINTLVFVVFLMGLVGYIKMITGVSPIPDIDVFFNSGLSIQTSYSQLLYPDKGDIGSIRLDIFQLSAVGTATFLSQVILLAINNLLLKSGVNKQKKALYLLMVAIALPAWYLTNSRTAVIVFILLLTALFLLHFRIPWSIVLIMSPGLAIAGGLIFPYLFPRFQGALDPAYSTNAGHYALWIEAIKMFFRQPLLGYGPGSFQIQFQDYLTFEGIRSWVTGTSDVHNVFLKTAAEMGILGLGALTWFFLVLFRDLWVATKHEFGKYAPGLARGLFLASLAGFLMTQTQNTFPKEFIWQIWGLSYTAVLMDRDSLDNDSKGAHPLGIR